MKPFKKSLFVLTIVTALVMTTACQKKSAESVSPKESPTEASSVAPSGGPSTDTGAEASPSPSPKEEKKLSFEGERDRTKVTRAENAGLTITNQQADSFDFKISSSYHANSGTLEGTAKLLSDKVGEYVIAPSDSNEGATVRFLLQEDQSIELVTEGDSHSLGLGADVTLAGTYVTGDPVFIGGPSKEEVLGSKEQEARMLSLLGESVYNEMGFVIDMGKTYVDGQQNFCGYMSDTGAEIMLRTQGEFIYFLDLGITGNGYTFYTNDPAYRQAIPESMSMELQDQPIEYVFKETL
ncbi:hypothetical protein [Gorillibacterium sp. CAU 1737]|uniref:hypothetical protein n=1 Tax=Gorillibacterium sp. CAU 1737 TaxID=3140362 RepID=UPI003261270C